MQRQNTTLRKNMLIDPDFLLTQGEYAKIRRCSERTIERERAAGNGCKFIKIGRAVRYRRRDILDFIERHARQSTSEKEPQEARPIHPGDWPVAVAAQQIERSITDPTRAEAGSGVAREARHRAVRVPQIQDRREKGTRGGREGPARLDPGRPHTNVPPRHAP